MTKISFKGWAIPGPSVPGGIAPAEDESLDALSGHFKIFQAKTGHRYSTDDLLTAWFAAIGSTAATRILDLGSGMGTVAMLLAWKFPSAQVLGIEAQSLSVGLSKKSRIFNGLESRWEIREGDFRNPAIFRGDEKFDLVAGTPPYFPLGTGILGDHPQKEACRFEMRGGIEDYCGVAAERLAPGAVFATIFPAQQETQVTRVRQSAAQAGLVLLRQRPVVFKEGEPALLRLFLMSKASDLPDAFRREIWVDPPLIIRTARGDIHPEYSVIKLSMGFPP